MSHDVELAVRILLALAVWVVLMVASVAGLVWLVVEGEWFISFFIVIVAYAGLSVGDRVRADPRAREPDDRDRERLEGALQRLALVAATPVPEAVVEQLRAPLSWTFSAPGRHPVVHVTTALLDRLDDPQLEAAVAHELGHVIHRDAGVMTLLAAVPAAFLVTVRDSLGGDWREVVSTLFLVGVAIPFAVLLLWTARIVSRHRELVADRTAAVLTGSPAAVAGALVTLSDGLARMRDRDLREVSPADVFHFLPARPPARGRSPWATHPRLEERLARLERMERELQG